MLAIDYLQRRKAFIEKIPFFILALIFGVIGFLGQRGAGAAMDMPGFAFTPLENVRLASALSTNLAKSWNPAAT